MIALDFGATILAQSRPSGTSAGDLYSPPAGKRAIVSQIIIANTTGTAANASVFADADGNTKTEATALMFAKSIAANTTDTSLSFAFQSGLELDEAGTLGCTTGTASALTFTVLGRLMDKT